MAHRCPYLKTEYIKRGLFRKELVYRCSVTNADVTCTANKRCLEQRAHFPVPYRLCSVYQSPKQG